jgi:anti-anti-sigma factor
MWDDLRVWKPTAGGSLAVVEGALRFVAESVAGVDVLRVGGEIDIATGHEFAERLDQALRSGRALVLDLRGVSYIDLRGIKAIETAAASASRAGQRLVVASSSSLFRRLLTILQGKGSIELATTVEQGVELARRPHSQ